MTRRRTIALVSPPPASVGPPEPPPDKGPLLTAQQILDRYFTVDGKRLTSRKWILANAPADKMVPISRNHCWHELDVRQWLASRQQRAS